MLLLHAGVDTVEPVRSLLADHADIEVSTALADCVRDVEDRRATRHPVDLVVVGPGVERPLTVGRRLSAADPAVALAFLVPTVDDVTGMETRLALSPDIAPAVVVALQAPPAQLWDRLHDHGSEAGQRRRLGGALDAINRSLRTAPAPTAPPSTRTVVSDRHLAALTRYAPDPIISLDSDFRIVAFNDAAVHTFGFSAEEAEGADVVDLLSWEPDEPNLRTSLETAVHGDPARDELRLRRGDGEPMVASMTAAPISNEFDDVVGVVMMGQDVTDRRRTEQRLQALQKAETLATLAGGVAHDFNNLLATILGWADIAAEEPEDVDTVRSALERIRTTAQRASDLARQMLAYSGRATLDIQYVDLDELVRDMIELLRSSSGRSTPIELDLHGELPEVHADPTQLRQVVLNLVTNASEAIAEQSGAVRISTSVEDVAGGLGRTEEGRDPDLPPGRYATLVVTDTGTGMDRETMRRVFDPFFSTKFTGRGLGLAATQGIVHAHGGEVTVDSEPDQGSTFVVWLPLDQATP